MVRRFLEPASPNKQEPASPDRQEPAPPNRQEPSVDYNEFIKGDSQVITNTPKSVLNEVHFLLTMLTISRMRTLLWLSN